MKQPKKLTREQKECLSAHYLNCKDMYMLTAPLSTEISTVSVA